MEIFNRCEARSPNLSTVYLTTLIALLDFSLTVKAATLIFISGCTKEGNSGLIYNLGKS